MSSRYEWLYAVTEPVEVMVKGEYVPTYDEPITEPLALRFGVDDGAIIEGTHEELVAMLERARVALDLRKKETP